MPASSRSRLIIVTAEKRWHIMTAHNDDIQRGLTTTYNGLQRLTTTYNDDIQRHTTTPYSDTRRRHTTTYNHLKPHTTTPYSDTRRRHTTTYNRIQQYTTMAYNDIRRRHLRPSESDKVERFLCVCIKMQNRKRQQAIYRPSTHSKNYVHTLDTLLIQGFGSSARDFFRTEDNVQTR